MQCCNPLICMPICVSYAASTTTLDFMVMVARER